MTSAGSMNKQWGDNHPIQGMTLQGISSGIISQIYRCRKMNEGGDLAKTKFVISSFLPLKSRQVISMITCCY